MTHLPTQPLLQFALLLESNHQRVGAASRYLSQLSRDRVESQMSVHSNNAGSAGERQVILENLLSTPSTPHKPGLILGRRTKITGGK